MSFRIVPGWNNNFFRGTTLLMMDLSAPPLFNKLVSEINKRVIERCLCGNTQ